jgi:hypothetical protein
MKKVEGRRKILFMLLLATWLAGASKKEVSSQFCKKTKKRRKRMKLSWPPELKIEQAGY